MAVSKLEAQFPIQCQLCDGEPNIKDKCLDCDLLMCKNCSDKVHIKFKNAKDHTVISIKELGQHSGGTTNVKYEQSNYVKDIKPELSIQSEYQTNFSIVSFIAVSLDDCLWIGETKDKKLLQLPSSRGLQKVRLEGKKTKVISSFNEKVNDIAITPSNDLLVVLPGDSTIKITNQHFTKLSDSVYKVDDLTSGCIHVTRDHQVIVGIYSEKRKRGSVIVMDKDGKYQTKYETDQNDKNIFPEESSSFNITSSRNGNVFVVHNYQVDRHGRVLVLNGGKIINIFTGEPARNTDKLFFPWDVTVTPSDNITVSDPRNHTLHILNNTGYLLKCVNTKDLGISWPCSLTMTTVGHFNFLFIGGSIYEDSKEKAKLYKLKFSGF